MSWKWCSGEPTFHIDGRPVQLTVRIPRDSLGSVQSVDVRAALPLGVDAEIVQGQAKKEILGVEYSFDTMNTDDEAAIGFSVKVTMDVSSELIPVLAELHDPRGAVTGNRLALGKSNEWVFIDGTIEQV